MFKKLAYFVAFVLVTALSTSLCSAAIEPVTSVTADNPDSTIPYNLLSITVGDYTVNADYLVVGTTTVGLTGNGEPWPEMDNLDIHDAIDTGLGTTATTMLFEGRSWIDTNGDNPDFFMFEAHSGDSSGDNPQIAAILSSGVTGQAVTLSGGSFGPTGYFRVSDAPDGMGMAGQQILGVSFAITDLLDTGGNPLTNDSVIEGIALTNRGGADITCLCAIKASEILVAHNPNPSNGTLHLDTWANLSWSPGSHAVSHDVYVGDNFADVDAGAESTFQGNQVETFIVAGFPGFPFPDGLVPGTTYYWRIDEINEAEPNSPWKGNTWSFSIPPKTAYFPVPADGAEAVALNDKLSWTAGFGAILHNVYFGDNFDDVSNDTGNPPLGSTTFDPGTLELAKTYYWRVDEFDAIETHKGNVWSFITEGAASNPSPAKGAIDVTQTPVLTWSPGVFADTHEVFFGADAASLENKGSGNLGSESYDPGQLEWNTTYYWRIDEANNASADSPWTGPLWSFTTANFLIIDDIESYNDIDEGEPGSNRIYNAWLDGFDDPTNGSQVGHLDPPFYEETIVHSGNKSMPLIYDNAVGKSEATLTLTDKRDWIVNGVDTLTIWFRGASGNAAEQMYVALNGSARINHDGPDAATLTSWTEWNIPLQTFADQGVNLSNVNSITIGLASVTGGTGTMYIDDIRLYPPAP